MIISHLLVNTPRVRGYLDKAVFLAAENGHTEAVVVLVEAGADVNKWWGGRSFVVAAAENGHVRMLTLLVEVGVNIRADKYAMSKAAENGYADAVRFLIRAKAEYGKGILGKAAENGHVAVVSVLLKARGNGKQSLNMAVLKNKIIAVKTLLAARVNVNSRVPRNPLITAASVGFDKIVSLLLEAGADVHVDDDGALLAAVAKGSVTIVSLLLNAGANVHAEDDEAVNIAVRHFLKPKIVSLLLNAGADVHTKRNLHLLDRLMGHWLGGARLYRKGEASAPSVFCEIALQIIAAGADAGVLTPNVLYRLLLMTMNDHVQLVPDGVSHDANVYATVDQMYEQMDSGDVADFALLNAAQSGHTEVISLLLKYVNAKDCYT